MGGIPVEYPCAKTIFFKLSGVQTSLREQESLSMGGTKGRHNGNFLVRAQLKKLTPTRLERITFRNSHLESDALPLRHEVIEYEIAVQLSFESFA
jgi:hypothetical protein